MKVVDDSIGAGGPPGTGALRHGAAQDPQRKAAAACHSGGRAKAVTPAT